MNKCVFIFVPFFILSLTLNAQEKRDTIHSVNKSTNATAKQKRNAIIDSLDLTIAQKKKLKELNKEFRGQLTEINENNQFTAAERKEQKKELLKKQQDGIDKILTPEQVVKYRKLIKQRRKMQQEMMFDE